MPAADSIWTSFRKHMPIIEQWAYFDHAAVAPLPEPSQQVIKEYADSYATLGTTNWPYWRKKIEMARNHAATLINAEAKNIAIVHSTTEGIGLVAEGFDWRDGDNVVVPDSEFPSNLFPWMNLAGRGVETRRVHCPEGRIDLDQLFGACDQRTRLISLSWVGFTTGWRTDLAAVCEMAHVRGIRVFVDAIQGMGVLPLDVQAVPIDFLAADGHKWMLGPEGAGVFYVRPDRLEELHPLGVGWNSIQDAGNFSNPEFRLKTNAGRYEGGTYNMVGTAGLAASLELLANAGIHNVGERLYAVTEELCERLKSINATIVSTRDENHWSGIVTFDIPDESPLAIKKRCEERGVAVNSRGGHLRASPHVYTNADDIDQLMDAISA
ncbi:aminotransferase class V-fold PLP-dependent enzyme [Thalassoroseus pseudoceratinae]|uniref:aminotransferase class V-fold PLP-dependent enzyme n=1 Tax=Thalassoroseus pseudoceratinae TaxID=2713176 RepID=UPI00141FB13A|nr:aminotransferase class V-fold PLP-dependent enzyme [Thalassoroseus pseudoceratinae]